MIHLCPSLGLIIVNYDDSVFVLVTSASTVTLPLYELCTLLAAVVICKSYV